ncbi:hypothetical protein TURU_018334 [Turdus rufiventris]|nr:hypothetical protein TURU_018334 [Turdus rufiventris]
MQKKIEGIACTLSRFADDTKVCGAVTTPEGWDAIQRNLDNLNLNLKKYGDLKLMRFNKIKCWCCTWVRAAPCLNTGWGMNRSEQLCKKDLGLLVDEKLDMIQPWSLIAKSVLGWIKSSVASRAREGILPLCSAETPPGALHPALGTQHGKDLLDLVHQDD